MPKITQPKPKAPMIRKTSLGSTAIELGDFRIVFHDKQYSVTQSNNGWHREHYITGRGWIIADIIPLEVEQALLSAVPSLGAFLNEEAKCLK